MPPYVPRKRLRDTSASSSKGKGKAQAEQPRKSTLFDDLDEGTAVSSAKRQDSGLRHLQAIEDSDSDLSTLSDAEFEDVPLAERRKEPTEPDDETDEDDEDIEFEDVPPRPGPAAVSVPSGGLELTLIPDTRVSLTNPFGDKKGPTKRERLTRNATHCVHVQCLLWHNALRNSWLCDPEVQGTLLSHLPRSLWDEVDRWRRNSGLEVADEPASEKSARGKASSGRKPTEKSSRDWGGAASRLENGAINMSHGDPLFRLMKALCGWWKTRFRVTAPGIRKMGYMSLERLDRVTKAFGKDGSDQARFGERSPTVETFRGYAQRCSGSRDVGAQLFTALLRGLGLETRMIANLQPLGFGWNKLEDADDEKDEKQPSALNTKETGSPSAAKASAINAATSKRRSQAASGDGGRASEDSDESELAGVDSDDEPIAALPARGLGAATVSFDKDLTFPNYWTEVLSPVTNKYLAVDALVKPVIATNRELVESLEPRGAKAEKSRQVMAYVVGFSHDGTAKDVTVRYLKRQTLPGKTKGVRYPIEKIPVYNKHGKVKGHETFDWFKTAMRGYTRGSREHPITELDEAEDSTELKPAKPQKKEVKEGEETLQYYKQSPEFVLERHLRREEALLPDALPVKVFRSKGKGGQESEENVYLRKDVVAVKSAETWHKQGRAPVKGEEALKRVPYRAATTRRRRDIAEAEAATGEKVLQGLYCFEQTDWIIPPPIRNGVIPKNEYGNIDLFVEHMCPEGAVHVPYRGAMRVCKRMGVDYAEAVVDFEFGHRMAVPVIQGVVVAEEYHDEVMAELAKDEAERSRKEDEKRRKASLAMWRKMLMGMRIVERIHQDYGEVREDEEVFGHSRVPDTRREAAHVREADEDTAGGFLPEGFEEEPEDAAHQRSSFFPVVDDEDMAGDAGDDLVVEGQDLPNRETLALPARGGRGKRKRSASAQPSSRRRRRRAADLSESEEAEGTEMMSHSEYEDG